MRRRIVEIRDIGLINQTKLILPTNPSWSCQLNHTDLSNSNLANLVNQNKLILSTEPNRFFQPNQINIVNQPNLVN